MNILLDKWLSSNPFLIVHNYSAEKLLLLVTVTAKKIQCIWDVL